MSNHTFSFGHLTAGEHEYAAKSAELADRVRELMDELYEADESHDAVYVRNSLGESLDIWRSGMLAYKPSNKKKAVFCLPPSRDRVYEIAVDFVCGNMEWWVGDFGKKRPRVGKGHLALFAKNRQGTIDFPLHQAAEEGRLALVKMLVTAGRDVNERDSHQCAPISYAAVNGHLAVCRFLVESGADVTVKDNWGNPLETLANEYPDLMQYLQGLAAGMTKDSGVKRKNPRSGNV